MGTTVDSLEIQLQAQAGKANNAIDTLITKLGTLNTSLTKINGSGLSGVANGVDKLSRSMQGLKNVGTADYTRLAKGIEKIANLNSGQIYKASGAIVKFGKGLQGLNSVNVSKASKQVADLANGIARLGYKSSTKAIDNIPKLSKAMLELMHNLSKAPRVSQNLIDMTNALGRLARTGASSGRAASALGNSLNTYTKSTHKARSGSKGLASALGKMYASWWLLFRFAGKIKDSINLASDLVEVQNVVDTVFGDMSSKVEEYAQKSIEQFGMSELSFKQYASRFQAMGSAMGIDTSSIESANSFLNKATGGYVGLSNSMADVSLNLTQLTADMASFYNVSQKDVAKDLEAIFTGETRPLRTYGLDLTQATLAEWAMKNGLDANVQSMSQAEKTMLRYQYVLANTSAAQGDFARTSNTWANQIRILQEQIKKFASIIGTGFIAAFKPFVQTLNKVMAKVIDFTKNVLNALGQIFGWEFEISGGGFSDDLGEVSTDIEDSAGNAGDLAGNLGQAAKNAKKLVTLGIDELNINAPDDKNAGGGGSGGSGGSGSGGVGSGGSGGLVANFKPNDKLLEAYKSSIKNLEQLGEYIGDTLTNAMNKIPWEKVYESSRNFGKGLADFLNGLISPELFGTVGKTIANSLNTAIYAALSFAENFDFYEFGASIASGINKFFENFDFKALAEGLNKWVDGLEDTISGSLKNLNYEKIKEQLGIFFDEIEVDTIGVIVGSILIKKILSVELGLEIGKKLKEKIASKILEKLGAISITGIGIKLKNFFISAINIDPASFSIVGSKILKSLGDAIYVFLPSWAEDLIENVVAGIALGGLSGSWIPVFGPAAGAIIGGILGALNSIKIDGKSILKTISDKIFNFDSTKQFFDNARKNFEKGGLNIVLGIIDGIGGALQALVEPIQDLFTWTWDVLCDVFGIHSPATSMYPIGENILYGIIEGIKSVWDKIKDVFSEFYNNKIKPWFTVEKWKELGENIKNGFSDISDFFKGIYEKIKDIFQPVGHWFGEKFSQAYESVKNAWAFVGTWFSQKWTDIKNAFKNVKQWFKAVFKGAYDGVTSIWSGIKSFFGKVANWIINPIQKAVNGVIDGINWVFDKVGAKKPLKNWTNYPKFASGSNGLPSDTIGVVNDQAGSTYKELIVPPHGKPFIPDGRNVMLPMKKGTKIMPAGQTKALMDGMPKFKNGIGSFFSNAWEKFTNFTGDVLDYVEHPSKILQIAIDKFTDLSGVSKFFVPLATGAVNKVFGSAVSYIEKLFDSVGGKGINGAIKWAIGIANDNKHGYDQARRTGPDYDCSSFVTTALKKAGFNIGLGTTSSMYGQLMTAGFKNVANSVNLSSGKGLKKGDVLLRPGAHTAMYVGDGKIVHASINELGRVTGGKTGDQTGKEIATRSYYNYPWTYVFRYAKGFKNGIGRIGISDLIPQYSVGGFPEDGLFMANRGELVGQFSNGQTAVANNYQIVGGIKDGVKEAVSEILAPYLSDIAQNTRETADKDLTVRIQDRDIVTSYERGKRRSGYSFT